MFCCFIVCFLRLTLRWKWWCVFAQCLSRMPPSPVPSLRWIPGRSKSPSWTPRPVRHRVLPPRKGWWLIRSLQRCSTLMLPSLLMHHRYKKTFWVNLLWYTDSLSCQDWEGKICTAFMSKNDNEARQQTVSLGQQNGGKQGTAGNPQRRNWLEFDSLRSKQRPHLKYCNVK